MTVKEIAEKLGLTPVSVADDAREVQGGYAGDLLSWVMGRAQADSVWITVMGNVNAVAVAVLADVACILLAEDAPLDDAARQKAEAQGVTVLQSSQAIYQLAVRLSHLLES